MRFSTAYHINGMRYTTVVYATNVREAEEFCVIRGMGEELLLQPSAAPEMPSDLISQFRWDDALHAACWLGMVGVSSGEITAFRLLHDQGLIHTLAHLIRKKPEDFITPSSALATLIDLAFTEALVLESRIPGFQRAPHDLPKINQAQAARMQTICQELSRRGR